MSIKRTRRDKWLRGPQGFISIVTLCFAAGLFLYQMTSSVLLAFSYSQWIGIRSLAAAAFPVSVAFYFAFIARVEIPVNSSRAPVINNFVIFLLWTLIIFWLDINSNMVRFPLEELIYSITLAFMIWRYKRQESVIDLLACCYGILSGSLAGLIFFGWNPVTM
ncbi:MAG: hypothetical protein ACFBSF_19515 [Leptolyngbyaceae cyanobacterium]